jgi:NAD+ synthase (glutamine-hydrolysing)
MKSISVAAGVLNTVPLAWDHNLEIAIAAIREARSRNVGLLCLPELCITGYGCEDAFHAVGVQDNAWSSLQALLPETCGIAVSVGLPVAFRNALFNCACLIADGKILGFYAKHFLAGDGIHYEPRWFKPWPQDVRATIERDGASYPIGDLHFDVGGIRIGFEVCEDAWVANRPGAGLARLGVDVILNPSASHFAFGKIDVRKRFVIEGSRAFGVAYIYANLLGNEAGRAIYDGGALIATGGALVAHGPRFGFSDWAITTANIDIQANRTSQTRTASFQPSFASDHGVHVAFEWPRGHAEQLGNNPSEFESSTTRKEEEFTRALALGLFDYLRKSHSAGFVVSLSGGADSAAVATLVAQMVAFALKDLGVDGVLAKLAHIPALSGRRDAKALVSALLTTVYQATANSSAETKKAAHQVAQALGSEHHEFDIEPLVQNYVGLAAKAIGRQLTWTSDDITLQNVQARVRAPGVWMLANLRGALLLTTSNRSEAAVGYATMDGDTAGGLAPIAGIDKAFLRHWLEWMQAQGPMGLSPLPELSCITIQRSSPELRPLQATQTSEADLMPFLVLDAIERAAIRDKRMPVEVLAVLERDFSAYKPAQLAAWIDRFFTLWCRNQWKRERYAPSFHLDDENLDPKTWCRFPILSGGFAKELAQLRSFVEKKSVAGGPRP